MADRTTKVMNCGQNPKPRLLTIRAAQRAQANQTGGETHRHSFPDAEQDQGGQPKYRLHMRLLSSNFALEGTCFALPPAVQVRFGAPVSATRPILLAAPL